MNQNRRNIQETICGALKLREMFFNCWHIFQLSSTLPLPLTWPTPTTSIGRKLRNTHFNTIEDFQIAIEEQ